MIVNSDYSTSIIRILRDEIFSKYNKFGGDYLSDGEIDDQKELFSRIDKNSDERVSKEELEDFLSQLKVDTKNSYEGGFLIENNEVIVGKNIIDNVRTMIEMGASYYSIKVEIENFSSYMINRWDQNGDDKLSREEFWDGVEEFMRYDTDFNNYVTAVDIKNKITGENEREIVDEKDLFIEILNKILVASSYSLGGLESGISIFA